MQANGPELILKYATKLISAEAQQSLERSADEADDSFGGIIKKGQLGWRAKGPTFSVFSLKSGQKISHFSFNTSFGLENCFITCIAEIDINLSNGCLLAIGIQYGDSPGGFIAVYSVPEAKILRCIEIADKITSCHFIHMDIVKRTILQIMRGCLAVGTDTGKILLLDLSLDNCEEVYLENNTADDVDLKLVPCHIVECHLDWHHIRQHYQHSKQHNVCFAIQLEDIDPPQLVLSLHSITPMLSLVAGLEDGRLIQYDLSELQLFHVTPPLQKLSPLVKFAYMEPPDDPRPSLYIWAFHENASGSFVVMHCLMYERRILEDDGICLFENFQSSSVRLTLPLHQAGSLPISCQAITKLTADDEETMSLCSLAWRNRDDTIIFVFDINQWYKEQMPSEGDWRENLSYLAYFHLKNTKPLDVYLHPKTIALFNSMQRPEEHFYPDALSFDCTVLQLNESLVLHWPGLQNRAINMLNEAGPLALLEPQKYFREVIRASLMPQFCEHDYNATFSIKMQREVLLSVAIEYNCFGLLKECAQNWSDGSHLGRTSSESLTLSTLTEWIWKTAGDIKTRCNTLCKTLFDYSGGTLDQREQYELTYLSRQLKLLANLLELITTKWKRKIPGEILEILESQYKSIRTSSEYQEILLWLVNIGLLPEAGQEDENSNFVPYPYVFLKKYYESRRSSFGKMNDGFVCRRTGSCRLLFVDALIQHECNGNALRDHWIENGGNGLYPPPSLQSMLRVLLIPDVSFENKCSLFLYFFLDLNMAIDNERYAHIVSNFIKFPAVFNLPASQIKTVQAFWNLDHCQFEAAIEEAISPFHRDRKLNQWQIELLMEALVSQNQSNFALRLLQSGKSQLPPILELNIYLTNDLISEAFHFARSKNDIKILKIFFFGCLCMGKYSVLRDLALTEAEGDIIVDLLKTHKSTRTDNLHFVYLLQKSKYIEALTFLDQMSKTKASKKPTDIETPSMVLLAYISTMSPLTRNLTDVYYKIKNRIKDKDTRNDSPNPLSCQLIQENAKNLLGGIYQSSALGTHYATYFWDGKSDEDHKLQNANNVPFLRKPQLEICGSVLDKDSVSYPEVYKGAQKRRFEDELRDQTELLENPQKRRKTSQQSADSILVSISGSNRHVNSLLTKFKDRNEHHEKLNPISTSALETQNTELSSKSSYSLFTPFVKSIREDDEESYAGDQSERSSTLRSILKDKAKGDENTPEEGKQLNNSDSSIRTSERMADSADDEKSIRFELPKSTHDFQLRSADSSVLSSTTVDDFYSPLSSKDNSREVENTMESSMQESPLKRRSDGPTPRPPLRAGYERSTKSRSRSATPETNAPVLSKSQRVACQPTTSNVKLSRFVLEETIKKSIRYEEEKILNVTKLDTNEFKPVVSSSKLADHAEKFTEKSTVVGGITYMETESMDLPSISGPRFSASETAKVEEENEGKNRMMDTTVDMSSADVTGFGLTDSLPDNVFSDTTTEVDNKDVEQTESSDVEMETNETLVSGGAIKPVEALDTQLEERQKCEQGQEEDLEEVDLLEAKSSPQNMGVEEASTNSETSNDSDSNDSDSESSSGRDKPDNDVVVILSSSSENESEGEEGDEDSNDEEDEDVVEEFEEQIVEEENQSDGEEADNLYGYTESTVSSYKHDNDSNGSSSNPPMSRSAENTSDLLYGDIYDNRPAARVADYQETFVKEENSLTCMSNVEYQPSSYSQEEQQQIELDYISSCGIDRGQLEATSTTLSEVGESSEQSSSVQLESVLSQEVQQEKDDVPDKIEVTVGQSSEPGSQMQVERPLNEDVPQTTANQENEVMEVDLSGSSEQAGEDIVLVESVVETSEVQEEPTESIIEVEEEDKTEEQQAIHSGLTRNLAECAIEVSSTNAISPDETMKPSDDVKLQENTEGKMQESVSNSQDADVSSTHEAEKLSDRSNENEVEKPFVQTEESEEISLRVSDNESEPPSEEVSTPKRTPSRKQRAQSVAQETVGFADSPSVRRVLRATSMPRSTSADLSDKKLTSESKSTSAEILTPSRMVTRRLSALMERIEENSPSTAESPSTRTRSRKRLESTDSASAVDTPTTATKPRTRRTSVSSTPDVSGTPRTRRKSIQMEAQQTPEVRGTPRSVRGRSVLSEDGAQTPSKILTRRLSLLKDSSPPEKSTPKTPSRKASEERDNTPSTSVDYSATRRLTRTQLAMMEKSAALASGLNITPVHTPKKTAKSTPSEISPSKSENSDVESTSSKISLRSGVSVPRRVTRSSVKDEREDDTISVASSTKSTKSASSTRKRGKPIKAAADTSEVNLDPIPEEAQEVHSGSENTSSSKEPTKKRLRTRRQKN